MKKPLIAIDIDDTIADSTESLRLRVNKHTGRHLPQSAYRVVGDYWGYYERVWEEHDIAHIVSHDDFAAEMVQDQSHVPLLPSALFALKELSKKFDLVFVTARDRTWERATREWFKNIFGDMNVQIYFINAHTYSEDMTKGELCKKLGATLLIDDNVEHCMSAQAEGTNPILFGEYGWHHTADKSLVRCKDWTAVLEYVNGRY